LKALRIARLMLREASLPRTLTRTPEPTAAMTAAESISGFDEQGAASLLPLYHFNALAINALAPRGASVVDLGCGTGRFLAYLAVHRPDLDIIGLDLAEEMVLAGRRHIADAGLADRVRLLHADMREFRKAVPARMDLVSSIFSLHHLPARDDLLACLHEIAAAISGDRSLLWIFDHVRPRRRRTAEEVPEIFTAEASPIFREDSRNSLCASWTFEELVTALRQTLPVEAQSAQSRLLPLYQVHWTSPRSTTNAAEWIEDSDLPSAARTEAQILSNLFGAVPGRARLRRSH
jgi:SAM-dependent methyltransferase